jgi:hypothetical protein
LAVNLSESHTFHKKEEPAGPDATLEELELSGEVTANTQATRTISQTEEPKGEKELIHDNALLGDEEHSKNEDTKPKISEQEEQQIKPELRFDNPSVANAVDNGDMHTTENTAEQEQPPQGSLGVCLTGNLTTGDTT